MTANQPHLVPNDEDNDPTASRNQTQYRYNLRSNAHAILYVNTFTNESTGKPEGYTPLSRGKDGATWIQAYANNLDRLAQGRLRRVTATNTIFFIHKEQVPTDCKVTYGKKSARYVQPRPKPTASASPSVATNYPTLVSPHHPAPAL